MLFRMGSYLQTGLFVTKNALLPLTFIIDHAILMTIILLLHLSDNRSLYDDKSFERQS